MFVVCVLAYRHKQGVLRGKGEERKGKLYSSLMIPL